MPSSNATRKTLLRLWRSGLAAADPAAAVAQALRSADFPNQLDVIAIGKMAIPMARAAASALKHRMRSCLIIAPRNGPQGTVPARARLLRGDHPVPSAASFRNGLLLKKFVDADDTTPLLFLISGGASAIAAAPKPGVSVRSKQKLIRQWLRQNVPIQELNRRRTALSSIKGGKLIARTRRKVLTLVLSDVVSDDVRVVGSGLTVPRRKRKNVRNRLILPCRFVAEAIARIARREGFHVHFFRRPVVGEAVRAGAKLAKRLRRLSPRTLAVSFGETTVRVRGKGKGGRNLELALGAAPHLAGQTISLLSISTDGMDGTSGAAGAFVDGSTMERAQRLGVNIRDVARRNDSARFFARLSDLVVTGPTGRNFADLQIAWNSFA